MIRRLAATVTVLLAAGALSACATFEQSDVAAEVNGVQLSVADLDAVVNNDDVAPQVGQSPGDVSRNVAELFIISVATDDLVTDEQRAGAAAQFDSQAIAWWADLPASVKDVFAHNSVLNGAGIAEEEIRARLDAADIYLNPRFGRWNGDVEQLEPMSP